MRIEKQNERRRKLQRARRAFTLMSVGTLWAWGCGSSEEQQRLADLMGSCSINSECKNPLICAFARCHKQCDEDRDCDPGLRCVHGENPGETVCQFADELECDVDKDCPGDQRCGPDDECRDACDEDDDCTWTQFCANSGHCASTSPKNDHVDEEGNIRTDGSGSAGGSAGGKGSGGSAGKGGGSNFGGAAGEGGSSTSASGGRGGSGPVGAGGTQGDGAASGDSGEGGTGSGTPGSGGSSSGSGGNGSGGTSGNGGTGGTLASGGTAGESSGGSGGMSGAGGSLGGGGGSPAGGSAGISGAGGNAGTGTAGAAGSGGSGEDLTETPDGNEVVENDTQEDAVPLTWAATINLTGADHDWFLVTPPMNGQTHIVTIGLDPDATLSPEVDIIAAADNSRIWMPHFETGVTTNFYVTVGPNAAIYLDFVRYSIASSMGNLRITLDITAENDAYEPNNDHEDPPLITTGEVLSGQLLNPWVDRYTILSEDWFAIDLVQGPATITFLTAPEEPRIRVRMRSPTNSTTGIDITTSGETPAFPFNVSQAGRYRIVLDPYGGTVDPYSPNPKPTYLDEQYSFVITQ